MDTLAGFDLVFAVSQKAINDQIALLPESVLPTTWKADLEEPGEPPRIDVQLDIPSVSLLTGNPGSRTVNVNIPITGLFTHNWVNADDVDGTFVISEPLVMSLLLPSWLL